MSKSEARSSKHETIPKPRSLSAKPILSGFKFRASCLFEFVSDFVLRISCFDKRIGFEFRAMNPWLFPTLAVSAAGYAAGTENWFLARAMRRREMDVRFVQIDGLPEKIPWPSIAGVRLRGPSGPGHFIAILGVEGESVVVGDPLVGRLTIRREEWLRRYHGAGFFMTVVKRQSKQVCSSS
jgi:hypothetical protein